MPALEAVTTDCPVNTAAAEGKAFEAMTTVGPDAVFDTVVVVSANCKAAAASSGAEVYFRTRAATAAHAAAKRPRRGSDDDGFGRLDSIADGGVVMTLL
jgi:hypothetical protein